MGYYQLPLILLPFILALFFQFPADEATEENLRKIAVSCNGNPQ
ncbi:MULTISPECIES: hypothetical protein [Nostocaceae]|nr:MULTISPECIES: hypothetical protein [Nostocaceae]